jgi:tetratricopeptide (TPR) repeat protein
MKRIEKTVFICYRRTNIPWALAIYQYLTSHGYDVFFDYRSVASGDFEQVILGNVKSRAHFIVILTPSALDRCDNPDDWVRREIETAIDTKRNIIPLMLESFDFGIPSIAKHLTDKLSLLSKYNGLRVPSEYFYEAMSRLREQFLNLPLSAVLHPVSDFANLATRQQKAIANSASLVQQHELTAQEWFGKGFKSTDTEEKIYYYQKAIGLDPKFADAYHNLGLVYSNLHNPEEAIAAYQNAININPKDASPHSGLGKVYFALGNHEEAIAAGQEAINLDPENAPAYSITGLAFSALKNYTEALEYFKIAVDLDPDTPSYLFSLAACYRKLNQEDEYRKYIEIARPLVDKSSEYNQACYMAICDKANEAIALLKIALKKKQVSLEYACNDPDFDFIRDDPQFKKLLKLE